MYSYPALLHTKTTTDDFHRETWVMSNHHYLESEAI